MPGWLEHQTELMQDKGRKVLPSATIAEGSWSSDQMKQRGFESGCGCKAGWCRLATMRFCTTVQRKVPCLTTADLPSVLGRGDWVEDQAIIVTRSGLPFSSSGGWTRFHVPAWHACFGHAESLFASAGTEQQAPRFHGLSQYGGELRVQCRCSEPVLRNLLQSGW